MTKNKTFKDWFIATRPWSFPASAMPSLVAITYVFYLYKSQDLYNVNWSYGWLALLGAVIFQASGNLISDYFDYKHGVDREETYGSSRLLVENVFAPKSILRFGQILLIIGSLIGIFLLTKTGLQLLYIGLFGVLGTYFYYILKFRALGDVLIFIIYGLLIAFGTAYVLSSQLLWEVLLVTSPLGLLIVNILHSNNTRDIIYDSQAGIKTQAMILGVRGSKIAYYINDLSAYLIVLILVVAGLLPYLSLLVFVAFPISMKNIKQIRLATKDNLGIIRDLDANSAKLVLLFSVLLSVGIFVSTFI